MTELIQFLMKNFYIVLFVLFILSRLMGKSGGKRSEPRMPNYGGDVSSHSEAPPKARERVPQVSNHRDTQNAAPQTVYRSRLESLPPEPEGGLEGPESDPYAEEPRSKRKSGSGGSNASPAKPRPSFASLGAGTSRPEVPAPESRKGLSKRELQNAFIWSEVLGPPKAKRTYRK